jgi:hypothetical protein
MHFMKLRLFILVSPVVWDVTLCLSSEQTAPTQYNKNPLSGGTTIGIRGSATYRDSVVLSNNRLVPVEDVGDVDETENQRYKSLFYQGCRQGPKECDDDQVDEEEATQVPATDAPDNITQIAETYAPDNITQVPETYAPGNVTQAPERYAPGNVTQANNETYTSDNVTQTPDANAAGNITQAPESYMPDNVTQTPDTYVPGNVTQAPETQAPNGTTPIDPPFTPFPTMRNTFPPTVSPTIAKPPPTSRPTGLSTSSPTWFATALNSSTISPTSSLDPMCRDIENQQTNLPLGTMSSETFSMEKSIEFQPNVVSSKDIEKYLSSMNIPMALWVANCNEEAMKYITENDGTRDLEQIENNEEKIYSELLPWSAVGKSTS